MQIEKFAHTRSLTALFWLPAIFTFAYVCFCAVNVPLYDEWITYVPLVIKYRQQSLAFGDFWAPLNEHRMFLPKLLTLATAIPSGYDTRMPMIATQFFMLAGFLLLTWRFKRDAADALKEYPLSILLLPALFYTWRQYDNYLFGIQVAFLMTTTFVIASSYFLAQSFSSENSSWRFWIFQLIALQFAVCASLCMSNGLFAWATAIVQLIIAIIFQRKHTLRLGAAIAVWFSLAVVAWYIYFDGSLPRAGGGVSLKRIVLSTVYFVGYIGSALTPDRTTSIIVGLFFLGTFGYIVVRAIKERTLMANNLWMGLATFGILSGLAIAWGRAEFGIGHSISSRYVAFSILFAIAVSALLFMMKESPPQKNLRKILVGIIVAGFIFGTLLQGIPKGVASRTRNGQLAATLKQFERHTDEELQAWYWRQDGALVRQRATLLKQYKMSVFRE
jgi:hypothetical protein